MGGVVQPVELDRLRDAGIDVVCLPEYFFVPSNCRNQIETAHHRQNILNQLESFSRRLVGVVIGGSLIEREGTRYYNACHVFDCGRHVGSYRKIRLTDRERDSDISPGQEPAIFEVRGIRLAVLICADVLLPENFKALSLLKPDLIAIPTVSPFLPEDTIQDKYRRDQDIFMAGAKAANAYLLKTCGVGTFMGKQLQGRSLICSPSEIISRILPREERLEKTLVSELDLDRLRSVPKSDGLNEYKAVINL